jgi:tetratricopeptide (TPR) repeat protein
MTRLETGLGGRSNDVAPLFDQALALFQGGRLAEAKRIARRILADQPAHAQTLHLLGVASSQQGNHTEGLRFIDAAMLIERKSASIHNSRGNVLVALQRFDEALASYDNAVALKSDYAEAFCNRGGALQELKRFDEALANYDRAIALKPDSAEALCNRGLALQELNRFDEALASYDNAIALKSDYAEAFCGRGAALQALERRDEALANYDQAIALKPDFVDAFCNRAAALRELKRLDEALANYDKAIALKYDHADGYKNRALVRLLMGRYSGGWKDNEWRWEAKDFPSERPNIKAPTWQGEDLSGCHLLVFSEQGLGDVIQFVRYLLLLAERKCKITFLAPAKLIPLLRIRSERIEIVSELRGVESFDFQVPLMSLPLIFNTRLETIPSKTPYLFASPERVKLWEGRLPKSHVPRVGIGWAGNPIFPEDRSRSIGLSRLVPLLSVPRVQFISLQKDLRSGDEELLREHPQVIHLGDRLDDFNDTAAVMSLLDLVISSDTAPVHLAGAIGRPVWVLLQYVPDWRWLLDRDDSPWYPSARLFRQPVAGDWDSVVAKVIEELSTRQWT